MIENQIQEAAETGASVRVTRKDGKTFVGKVEEVEGLTLTFKILSGKRGRPATFHVDDVETIEEV